MPPTASVRSVTISVVGVVAIPMSMASRPLDMTAPMTLYMNASPLGRVSRPTTTGPLGSVAQYASVRRVTTSASMVCPTMPRAPATENKSWFDIRVGRRCQPAMPEYRGWAGEPANSKTRRTNAAYGRLRRVIREFAFVLLRRKLRGAHPKFGEAPDSIQPSRCVPYAYNAHAGTTERYAVYAKTFE